MENFNTLQLHSVLAASLARMGYEKPTPIQAQAIPFALKGRDVMGSAQTGTGKTAAFAIPLVESLLRNPEGTALVLTPTRELGKQIMDIMKQLLGPKSSIKTAFIIGGESMGKQFDQLRQKPRLIVGTPGRINDHLERGSLKLDTARFLVLDETDRMLDMGFTIQLDRIFKHMPKERQTMMFSATLPKNILTLSKNYLTNPERVSVGEANTPATAIKQDVIFVEDEGKLEALDKELDERKGSIIVFVKTKYGTEKLAKKLNDRDHSAQAIHGDLKQNKRDRVIQDFRASKYRVLVATDVVARGLDIPHIEHVINYDLPQAPEDYIHRIGRTARAGAEGSALCLISNADRRKWHAITRLINPGEKQERYERPGGAKKPFGAKKRPFGSAAKQGDGFKPRGEGGFKGKSDRGANGGNAGAPQRARKPHRKGGYGPKKAAA